MTVDNPLPEESAAGSWFAAVGVAALEAVPVVGPAAAALVAEGMRRAQRVRDEEWAAMTVARLASLESHGAKIDVADPTFLAAVARASRAASETADSAKRELLARAASRAGEWCGAPHERRAEFVELVAEMSVLQVRVVARAAVGTAAERGRGGREMNLRETSEQLAAALGEDPYDVDRAVSRSIDAGLLETDGRPSGYHHGTTPFGDEFLSYLLTPDADVVR